jgi:hypothetical protein
VKISASFVPTRWDEVDYGPILNGTKTTKASIEYSFSGEIDGKASVEYLMFYRSFDPADMHASEATFTGLAQVTGSLDGKTGTFTVQENGTFSAGIVNTTLLILEGSGIDGFKGISGQGTGYAGSSGAHWNLEIHLP